MKSKWEDTGMGNSILKGEDFFISYNPHTGAGHGVFTEVGNMLGGDLKDGEETALVKGINYKILTGDFRKEYEELVPKGYEACVEYFEKMEPEFRNNWSTDTHVE